LEKIGKYRIIEKIGQGATSSVYKGYDAALDRRVAVKTIAMEPGGENETLRRRFEREAQSAARLNHPHIITVFDYGEEQNKLYMAMELLEGEDLKRVIAEQRLATLVDKVEVIQQIADGLAFAHANGIVHRDLKPANIHLLPDGQVKIMDFGLARLTGSDMTRTGLVMGTPYYMSPEQVRGEHVDARCDVFALGCVFYEVLTGKRAFDAESLHSVLYKVMQAEPRPVRQLAPDLPIPLVQVLEKAMAKDPARRFPDAGAFAAGLEHAREAIASGRGDEPLPELVLGPPVPAAARPSGPPPGEGVSLPSPPRSGAPGSPARSIERPTPASRPSDARLAGRPSSRPSMRSVAPPGSRAPALAAAGLALLLLAVAGVLVVRNLPGASPPATSTGQPEKLDELTRMAVETQTELARKRLDAGDYRDAYQRSERVLKLDPANEAAQKILAQARDQKDRTDEAVRQARAAVEGADRGLAAEAYWKLLLADPDDAAAAELAPQLDAVFESRAAEAQRLMEASRGAAAKTAAARLDSFREGTSLAQVAEGNLKARKFAAAARDFLKARQRFDRAQRSAR
jgi:serine/threonine protein kinase/Tfp pilus assembly protein PilF